MPDFNGTIASAGEVDNFSVVLTAGVQYFVEVEGAATLGTLSDPLVVVTLGAGEVNTDDDGGVGLDARAVFTAPSDGTYVVSVSGDASSIGTYALRVNPDDFRDTAEGNGDAGLAGNRQPAQTGTINYAGDGDTFSTELIGGLNYAFYARGSASLHGTLADPQLSLTDGLGTELASSSGAGDAFFQYGPADSGTYWLVASGAGAGVGSYDVLAGAGRGDNSANFIVGTDSSDNVNGLGGNDIINGGRGLDRLMGGNGSDVIDGAGGGDLMIGGAGNDRYFVDNPNDRIVEAADEGIDTIFASAWPVAGVMGANIENLTVVGAASLEVEGNELDNVIRGGDVGGPVGYLAGNAGDDWIYGGAGDDLIIGGSGDDRLVGGAGADQFVFATSGDPSLDVSGDRDTIYAFESAVDQLLIGFDGAAMTYIGGVAFTGTAGQVRYDGDSVTGDANGDGVADFEIVISNHAALTAANFVDFGM